MDAYTIQHAEDGGYFVSVPPRQYAASVVFAGTLGECLAYVAKKLNGLDRLEPSPHSDVAPSITADWMRNHARYGGVEGQAADAVAKEAAATREFGERPGSALPPAFRSRAEHAERPRGESNINDIF